MDWLLGGWSKGTQGGGSFEVLKMDKMISQLYIDSDNATAKLGF